jgi:putative transposase
LSTEWLLANFAPHKSKVIERYKQFIAQGKSQPSLCSTMRKQICLGVRQFIDNMQSLINEGQGLREIPSAQRKSVPGTLDDYLATSEVRNTAICKAYQGGGYTLKQLGDYFTPHYSTVSGIVNNHKSKTCPKILHELFYY